MVKQPSKVDPVRFRELWESGATYKEIRREFGISQYTVRNIARRLILPKRFKLIRKVDPERLKELWENGAAYKEIAREFGISEGTVGWWVQKLNLAKRGRRRKIKVDPERLRELVERGFDDLEIARELGVSHNTIKIYRNRMKLKSVAPPKRRKLNILTILDQFEPNVMVTERWIAEELNIPLSFVREKIRILERLGAVVQVSRGIWKLNTESVWAAIANGVYYEWLGKDNSVK